MHLQGKLKELIIAGKFRARKKLQAIYLSDQGRTFQDIARRCGCTYRTVQNWMREYRVKGFADFVCSL